MVGWLLRHTLNQEVAGWLVIAAQAFCGLKSEEKNIDGSAQLVGGGVRPFAE